MALPLVLQFEDVGLHQVELSVDQQVIWNAPLRIRVELPPLE
jgi:hypothetical protein